MRKPGGTTPIGHAKVCQYDCMKVSLGNAKETAKPL